MYGSSHLSTLQSVGSANRTGPWRSAHRWSFMRNRIAARKMIIVHSRDACVAATNVQLLHAQHATASQCLLRWMRHAEYYSEPTAITVSNEPTLIRRVHTITHATMRSSTATHLAIPDVPYHASNGMQHGRELQAPFRPSRTHSQPQPARGTALQGNEHTIPLQTFSKHRSSLAAVPSAELPLLPMPRGRVCRRRRGGRGL